VIRANNRDQIGKYSFYYDLAQVSFAANPHCISLILNFPLKPAERQFVLFKAITLPVRVDLGKFVQYALEHVYFPLQHSQQANALFTEEDYAV
jgi:hypothetical protein